MSWAKAPDATPAMTANESNADIERMIPSGQFGARRLTRERPVRNVDTTAWS